MSKGLAKAALIVGAVAIAATGVGAVLGASAFASAATVTTVGGIPMLSYTTSAFAAAAGAFASASSTLQARAIGIGFVRLGA